MEWTVVGIVALPLAGAVVNGLLGGRLGARAVSGIGCLVVLGAFGLGVVGFRELALASPEAALRAALGEWIVSGDFRVAWELKLDRLAAVMVLVVTGVGFLIHVYSVGYMHGDEAYSRYFTYLNLFVASMLLLVLGGNLLVFFVGWELVGLCSYLLIGFWFERPSAAAAGRKAFVTNRIGDAAFLLGICLLAVTLGTLEFDGLQKRLPQAPPAALTAAALLLFAGATGKSAQLPLYVWLPDAMEGPTPVSALIHAATMVTAGVYMVARLWPLYVASGVLPVVAAVGGFTALFAATVAVAQTDLKRILAYSTISQIGYMFLGLGAGSGVAGMFHLTTHAFFKALLFLSAGSVMHALHGLIDVRRLGGLSRAMPFTAASFLVGAVSLSGIPPLAGFFSKEHILTAAHARGLTALWTVGVLTAGITALYITRAALLTFADPPADPARRPHEAPPVMRWPMGVLLVLSAVGGFLGAKALGAPFDRFLLPVFEQEPAPVPEHGASGDLTLALASVGAALGGIAVGWIAYRGRRMPELGALGRVLSRQWYVEDLYQTVLVHPARALALFWARVVDLQWIDGAANGLAAVVGALGAGVRRWQTGYVRQYAAWFLAGTVLAVGYWLLR
jgi:NADH-quinone oxidoreductase subunit L